MLWIWTNLHFRFWIFLLKREKRFGLSKLILKFYSKNHNIINLWMAWLGLATAHHANAFHHFIYHFMFVCKYELFLSNNINIWKCLINIIHLFKIYILNFLPFFLCKYFHINCYIIIVHLYWKWIVLLEKIDQDAMKYLCK